VIARDEEKSITRVLHAIEVIKSGQMVIMCDDEHRENEGDLVFAAERVTPDKINFMVKEARGLVCLTMEPHLVEKLALPMMSGGAANTSHGTAFTVSIEARDGVTTGISAYDRCHTIKTAIAETTTPSDIVVPGHIFPLKAKPGGVLERAGHTEGSVDLVKMAGMKGAGVICEIMNDDGSMARMPDLEEFSRKHNIPVVTIADLITFRLLKDSLVKKLSERSIKTDFGEINCHLYQSLVDGSKHLALTKGGEYENDVVDIRVHNQRQLADVFGSLDGSCGSRITYGLNLLKSYEKGVFLYLTHHESQDFFTEELDLLFQDRKGEAPRDLSPKPNTDHRMNGIGSQILRSLGVRTMRIHTYSHSVPKGLSGFGLEVAEIVDMQSSIKKG
jgi:3,4-dihydroxy 2-butanone 4-phosphate synthase / GTP cyclohydrolase II